MNQLQSTTCIFVMHQLFLNDYSIVNCNGLWNCYFIYKEMVCPHAKQKWYDYLSSMSMILSCFVLSIIAYFKINYWKLISYSSILRPFRVMKYARTYYILLTKKEILYIIFKQSWYFSKHDPVKECSPIQCITEIIT